MTPDWETAYHEVMEENLALAAIAGNLRNQLDATIEAREKGVEARELVARSRAVLAGPNQPKDQIRALRAILGVNYL